MTGRKISGPKLTDPAAQTVCRMLTDAGHQAWFVGGCVRNALLGLPISDVDIATDARPDEVMTLARQAGLRPVPTGFEHGTVTVVADGKPFEVTTFRRDVETDGRRAVVAFAETLEDDARRRDFTMNALYATPNGEIEDPLGGLPDVLNRRVKFIDDARARIREDYLRILRFFRFHAWYGDPNTPPDPEAIGAIEELSAGIETLSRERIGLEMKKLLAAPDPVGSVAEMERAGVLARVVPGASLGVLPRLVELEARHGIAPDPIRRLAALGGSEQAERLRLSRAEARRLERLLAERGAKATPEELGYRFGPNEGRDIALLRAASGDEALPPDLASRLAAGARAQFPVRARDLMPALSGAALGARLRALEARWIASGFTLSREELLEGGR